MSARLEGPYNLTVPADPCCDDPVYQIRYTDHVYFSVEVVNGETFRYEEPDSEDVSVDSVLVCQACDAEFSDDGTKKGQP